MAARLGRVPALRLHSTCGMNMFLLWLLGSVLEPALGRAPLRAALRDIAARRVAGRSVAVARRDGGGCVGRVFGLMGAMVVLQLRARQNPWHSGIGSLVVLNLVITFARPRHLHRRSPRWTAGRCRGRGVGHPAALAPGEREGQGRLRGAVRPGPGGGGGPCRAGLRRAPPRVLLRSAAQPAVGAPSTRCLRLRRLVFQMWRNTGLATKEPTRAAHPPREHQPFAPHEPGAAGPRPGPGPPAAA